MNPPPLAVQTEYPGKSHRVLIGATVLPVHRLHTGLMYSVYVYFCGISKTCNNRVIFHKYVFPNSYISPLESSPPDSVKYEYK